MNKTCIAVLFALSAAAQAATVVTVNWAASTDNGFGLQNGSLLPVGNEVRIGVFDFPVATLEADIQGFLSQNNLAGLATHFTTFDTAIIGVDAFAGNLGTVPLAERSGLFETASGGIEVPTNSPLFGKQLYMWVFKTNTDTAVSGDFSNVLQTGIFGSTLPSWGFPADSGLPEARSLELTNLSDGNSLGSTADVIWGTFGTSTTPLATGDNHVFMLAPAPEPSTAVAVLSGLALLGLRRRRA